MQSRLIGAMILGMPFFGCRHSGVPSDSMVKVTNGIDTIDYPYVVELQNKTIGIVCSGTFVSDSTLLTAGHCVDGSPTSGLTYNGMSPTQAFFSGPFGEAAALKKTDQAILVFPPGTAPGQVAISPVAPTTGATVTLVGFGYNDLSDPSSLGVKREGANTVAGLSPPFIHLVGLPSASPPPIAAAAPSGVDSASAPGDSGGPMFFNFLLAATDSGGSVHADGKKHSYYIDLSSTESCGLMNAASAGGALFPQLPAACAAVPAAVLTPTSPTAATVVPPTKN